MSSHTPAEQGTSYNKDGLANPAWRCHSIELAVNQFGAFFFWRFCFSGQPDYLHSQKGNMMTITEKQNALFEELRKTVPEAVLDGVVEEMEYCSAPMRLMFVLKEVNGKTVLDLCDFLRKGGRPQTWDNIARWTEGIFHLEKDWSWEYWEQNNQSRRERMLKKICAVNVKKTAGGHTSDRKQVQKAAADNGQILCRQLKLYNPDLVVCCGTDQEFVKACYPDQPLEWKQTTRGIWYFKADGKIVVSFVHPEARVKDSILHYALMDAVREIMQKKFSELTQDAVQ